MKRIALLLAGLLVSQTASAQQSGSVTLVVSPMPQPQIQSLDSATLAIQVRQLINNGALSGTPIPLLLDGQNHAKRIRLGGEPGVYVDRRMTRTVVQGVQRDMLISYGPSRSGGIGVHAEIVDSTLTPQGDGSVRRDDGRRSEITGVVPRDGRPQAIMTQSQPAPGSVVLPLTLIVLVEP